MTTRAPLPAPHRLLAMAAWVPRVFLFAWTVEPRFRREPVRVYLSAITPARAAGGPPLTPDEMVRVIANVLRWKRGRLNHGCFVRSLTRYHFLRRLGVPVSFELGVERAGGGGAAAGVDGGADGGAAAGVDGEADGGHGAGVDAVVNGPADAAAGADWQRSALRSHAWLSLGGRPYLETEAERIKAYRSLLSWPPA